MKFIKIGQIVKPQGIKGQVKVKPLTDDVSRFDDLKSVYIDGTEFAIQQTSYLNNFVVLKLKGIDDRNSAETLKDKFIQIDKANAVELGENEYFISDLIGCTIKDEANKKIGEITDCENFGSADVITGKILTKEFRFPFLNKIVIKIDTNSKEFVVNKKLWEEVVVFDD